jgi:hypothetical protein
VNLGFVNPELLRNARIQLRPGRMIAAGVICCVVSVTLWMSIVHTDNDIELYGWHKAGAVFALILLLQVIVLLIAGGIYCIQAVHKEKELNTFDYQRVTRLTSLELAIGKLFGAPILTYWLVLCLMPFAVMAAAKAEVAAVTVVEAYAILLLGSIAFHAFMLLVSVLLGRSGVVVSILLYLMLIGLCSVDFTQGTPWAIHRLSPFYGGDLISRIHWSWNTADWSANGNDVFFGRQLPHTAVLLVLYVAFTAWFAFAVARNIKRDPATYEVLSPLQLLVFFLFINLLMLGFCSWTRPEVSANEEAEPELLVYSLWTLWLFAFFLLRSRERVRTRIRKFGDRAAGWWAAVWPAPYLIIGAAILGGAVVALTVHHKSVKFQWDQKLAFYYVAFLAIWLARDTLYLQWMGLRRRKYPVASAVLYLLIFYVCTTILFGAFDVYNTPRGSAFTAAFIPSAFFAISQRTWGPASGAWMMALLSQAALAVVFARLHKMKLDEFVRVNASEPPTTGTS